MRSLLLLPLLLAACAPAATTTRVFPDVALTLPAPAGADTVRVIVMGDQGKGGAVQDAVARAMRAVCRDLGCDLGLGMGDNFYPKAPPDARSPLFRERFAALYGEIGVPFLMAAGNHDESWVQGGDGADPAGLESELGYARLDPQWVMPAHFYRAAWADLLQVFVVDTSPLASYLPNRDPVFRPGGPFERAQRDWLRGALAGSAARWNVVVGHHPLLNNGLHGSAGSYTYGRLLPWAGGEPVRALYRDAACGRADVIAAGHDHTLQVFPADNAACPGTRLIVSGAAGEVTGPGPGRTPSEFQAMNTPGFFWMSFTRDALTLRAFTVDAAGVPTQAYASVTRKP